MIKYGCVLLQVVLGEGHYICWAWLINKQYHYLRMNVSCFCVALLMLLGAHSDPVLGFDKVGLEFPAVQTGLRILHNNADIAHGIQMCGQVTTWLVGPTMRVVTNLGVGKEVEFVGVV